MAHSGRGRGAGNKGLEGLGLAGQRHRDVPGAETGGGLAEPAGQLRLPSGSSGSPRFAVGGQAVRGLCRRGERAQTGTGVRADRLALWLVPQPGEPTAGSEYNQQVFGEMMCCQQFARPPIPSLCCRVEWGRGAVPVEPGSRAACP